jgi:TonB family protein
MKNILFLFVLLCCYMSPWLEQSAAGTGQQQERQPYFKGVVMDFVTKARISGAKVQVEGTKLEASSDEKGEFEVEGWIPGVYAIRVTHSQYRPLLCKNFQIGKGGRHAGFLLKAGSPNDQPVIRDDRPLGQFVIDEDAEPMEKTEPAYPASALKDKIEGTVLLNVYVNEEGDVVSAFIGQGVRDDLNRAALEAVQYFKFKPARVKGKPVSVPVTIPFVFKLADKSSAFPLKQIEGPLTPDEISAALSFLGFKIERYSYVLPYRHCLRVTIEQWIKGRQVDGRMARSVAGMASGKNNVVVLLKESGDNLEFGVQTGHGSSTLGTLSRKGFGASTWSGFENAKLQANTKTPIFVFAANSGRISSIDTNKSTLEEIAARHDFVAAVIAELLYE